MLKYINDNPEKGIAYDWKKIINTLKKLKIPRGVYNPSDYPLGSGCHYFVAYSERGVGKSTQWILIGIIMFFLYGTHTVYIREDKEMITQKNTIDMLNLINSCGYIDRLTKGKYNTAIYKARRWYLAKVDEEGDIVSKSSDWFMLQTSVMDGYKLKSTINDPVADLLIFDEFISPRIQPPDLFPRFCDLVSTFVRTRQSPIVVLLTNTLDRESFMWHELEIHKHIREMHKGDKRLIQTSLGMYIYVDFVSVLEVSAKKRLVNKLFFGFRNPKLAPITGEEDWNIQAFPHINRELIEESTSTNINIYIKHYGNLYRLDSYIHPVQGIFVCVHPATKTYENSYILTLDEFDITDRKRLYIYAWGKQSPIAPIMRKYTEAMDRNLWFYDNNDTGSAIKSYISCVLSARSLLRK